MLKLGTIDEFKSLVTEGKGFAKQNLYYVKFPTVAGINAYDLGLLCSRISLPERQLATVEREMGITTQKVVHGFINPDVNMTFRVLNDQKVRNYFESWQQYILPQYSDEGERYEVRYPDQYVAPIHIYQMERGKSFPLFNRQFDKKLGPINLNIDIDVDAGVSEIANYHWMLDRAYPLTVSHGELSEGANEISEINVNFAYRNYESEPLNGKGKASIFLNGSNTVDLNI